MSSPLLALAAGALKGANDNRERKREREREDLETTLRLQSMPGVSLEDPATQPTQDLLTVASSILPAATAGVGGVTAPAPAPKPGKVAGEVTIGGKRQAVRVDPTQTVEGRRVAQDQANRASHARLQQLDPTLWNGTYDPNYDYGGAERDESKKASTEQQLIAAGWDAKRARIFARTGFDAKKREEELESKDTAQKRLGLEERRVAALEQTAASSAAARTEATDAKTAKELEGTAGKTALGWALEGRRQKIADSTLQQQIADALAPVFPTMTYAQRVGAAAQAMMTSAPKATAKAKGPRIPGLPAGVTVPAVGDSSARRTNTAKLDPAKEREKVIGELVTAGKTKEEIKAELRKRGLL
ncbi:MAG: hypothetical protein ACJ768_19605 [Gaiellaceae bacterium]